MRKTVLYVGVFLVMSSLLGSCVSKKKYEELEKLSEALEEAGVSVDEVLAQLKSDDQENIA